MWFFTISTVLSAFALAFLACVRPRRVKRNERRRIEREAVRRKCKPAPVMPYKGFLGLGRLREGLRATREGRGPQYVIEAINAEMGEHIHTVVVPIFDYELVVSRDPIVIHTVLSNAASDWDISEHRAESWKPLVGNGIFTSRGAEWKHSRSLIRPQFAMDQINDIDMFERHVQHLFEVIDERWDQNLDTKRTDIFDLQPLFYNLTLDIVTEMLFGYSVHSQSPSQRTQLPIVPGYKTPDRANIGKHMDAGKAWVETRGALWKYRWLLPSWQFNRHCAAVHEYAEYFVQLRLQRGDKYLEGLDQHRKVDGNGERFVLLHELAKVTQDPEELRSQPLNVLTAGRDTTAALLGWMFYLLARHPEVLEQLREEVLSLFGRYIPGSPVQVEFKQLRDNMPYMQAVINETLRVAPVVPLNDRIALRDTVLPRGGGPNHDEPMFVPKGTQILIPTYALGMRSTFWGPDSHQFNPDRWLRKTGRPGFEYIPFGGGSRQCLGRKLSIPRYCLVFEADANQRAEQLARIKAAYVTGRILQRFDMIENMESPADAPMNFHHTIENRSGTGVQIRMRFAEWEEHKPQEEGILY